MLSFIFTAVLAAALTFAGKRIALKIGMLSEPRRDRWHQSGPVPKLGGPSILVAISIFVDPLTLTALAGFCIVGLIDDFRPLGPGLKATLLIVPCVFSSWLLGNIWIGPMCWIAANALNLLDHADGLAGSSSAGSLLVASGPLGIAGSGASIGFLLHNYPPARVFLGDSGSLMLGALLVFAWAPHGVVATLAGLAVPLLDAGFVIVRRLRSHTAPWIGGTDHSGHSLLRLGIDPKFLPLLYGIVSAIFAWSGVIFF